MPISEERKIKLESMQVKGIRCLLRENVDKESLELRLLQVTGQVSIRDVGKFLDTLSRNMLIRTVEQSPEITDLMVDSAYERYRYGLKPGFTLFWAKRHINTTLTKEDLETKIKEYVEKIHYQDDDKYKNLEFVSIVSFDNVYEVTFSYLQRFNYVNPEGEFTYVYMLKEGFVWLGMDKHFIAINNMPEVLVTSLKRLFSKIYSVDITNIKVTKSLLTKVFSEEKAKRVTRHSSNPPANQLAKISYADPDLSAKQDCIPAGYENYDITNTQYAEDIDGDTIGTLGVNCNKGKFYLSKSLSSTQFRNWSVRRITDIINYFQGINEISVDAVSGYNMFSSSAWEGTKQTSVDLLNQIVYGLINCKQNHLEAVPLPLDIYKVYQELNKYFHCRIAYVCEECNDKAIASCDSCGSSNFTITKKGTSKVICANCGHSQEEPFLFTCESGHTSSFTNINEVIELIATDELVEKLWATIKFYYPKYEISKNEYFVINQAGLEIHSSPDYEKLKPSDIVEFSDIAYRQTTKSEGELIKILLALREKCSYPTNDQCATCHSTVCKNVSDIGCMLRLFEKFEGFTPQTHQGHEFGDVSMLVTLHGKNMTFCAAAKSVPTVKKQQKVTKASTLGREIIQQVLDMFNDARTEIIGVIYPYLIDDQLKHFLYHYAKMNNKRLVILDYEFMVKLLDKYIEENNLII